MSIKKLDDGRYEVDVRPQGSEGKRIRRKFDSKVRHPFLSVTYWSTITRRIGWKNRQTVAN